MTRLDHIRTHLESGKSITAAQAWRWYDITSLRDVIYLLRKKGMDIEGVVMYSMRTRKPYTKYFLRS